MTACDVKLRCGTLHLDVAWSEWPLEELCGFASRRSRKRGFVFVSKVLGKHYPVRPRVMAEVHASLASRLVALPGPVLLIALAETATGLGQGIYEAMLRAGGRTDALFLHTTRYQLRRRAALHFEESHSHAIAHRVFEPADHHHHTFHQAKTLVLVDDELSTGRTLANLATAYRQLNDNLTSVHLVCLTDWLGPARRAELAAQIGLPTIVHSLLEGVFALDEDAAFDPGPIPNVTGAGDFKDAWLPVNHGRLGVHAPLDFNFDDLIRAADLRPGQRILVLGTGEFAYPPFLFARQIEQRGCDVHYQSTTRSPLLIGNDLTCALEFVDNYHDGIPNYVYNVTDRQYDKIVICYETWPLPAAHTLPQRIGAQPVFFGNAVELKALSAQS